MNESLYIPLAALTINSFTAYSWNFWRCTCFTQARVHTKRQNAWEPGGKENLTYKRGKRNSKDDNVAAGRENNQQMRKGQKALGKNPLRKTWTDGFGMQEIILRGAL